MIPVESVAGAAKAWDVSPVTIVDYGVGNIQALINILDHLGIESVASADPHAVARARKLILPGVGAFDKAMRALRAGSMLEALTEAVVGAGVPVLGVCLGMHLLATCSEEGAERGLGWIPGKVRRIVLPAGSGLKVPHIGWSEITPTKNSLLFKAGSFGERFYFVHSYHLHCDDPADVAATFDYDQVMCCAVSRGTIHGVQFHPEKSHRFGMRVLGAFATHSSIAHINA